MSFCLSGCYWKPEFKTKHLTGREGRQSEKWGHFWWNLFSLQQSSCWTVWASSLWDLDIIVTVITKTNYRPNVLYNCQKVCSSSSNCESALHPICKLASKICFPAAVCCSAEPLYCKIYAWLVKFVMQKKMWCLRDILCSYENSYARDIPVRQEWSAETLSEHGCTQAGSVTVLNVGVISFSLLTWSCAETKFIVSSCRSLWCKIRKIISLLECNNLCIKLDVACKSHGKYVAK